MQEMPLEIAKWTELKFPEGRRFLKDDAPEDIRRAAIEWERDFLRAYLPALLNGKMTRMKNEIEYDDRS